ncbi:hypothetical protein LTR10_017326 [Elasticomyces elasticus]|uniref:Uncharacterized protein n=1 Tax=Exophiala sideris TaxID=1016849 RepID=A0ABR0J8W7_9EURO|nr:hypothetical protein LTR10_017326 [Elasticomyces elasticus]KAK5037493.1 hypothetical protein LTR13_004650 [Exophiala sideris]KAK5059154.1 hypothetical protein LTR69_006443 [Exophiala sideris]KAK5182988.1 hypothetical protein LTR44_004698 [Eurotiomycetes sp. CCFEE 6388]
MLQSTDIHRLKDFHATHFPGQITPEITIVSGRAKDEPDLQHLPVPEVVDDLGFYQDGVKRTLTEEQVKMFRHSEIQRLLKERRIAREKEEKQRKRQAVELERTKAQQHFDDHPKNSDNSVDTLMYDEQPDVVTKGGPATKTFLWPKLGGP